MSFETVTIFEGMNLFLRTKHEVFLEWRIYAYTQKIDRSVLYKFEAKERFLEEQN